MGRLRFSILFLSIIGVLSVKGQNDALQSKMSVDLNDGHAIKEGVSGFNVRIADKVWNYTHPDFRNAVHGLQPGWLRFFSGTMGDAFSAATGQYDMDYAWMFEKRGQYEKGYKFTEVKGPHRIIDLYHLLGEVNGKLIVTINGFSETPDITAELSRFCKNNNIIVETWQFCNEPYFYVPGRERYWWNDGYDYARKMKPHADSIRVVFPDAQMALNCTWDGIWSFMKEIHQYQQEKGAYWNVFSKHSYAPHVGGKESFEKAYRRANTKVLQATSQKAMKDIEKYSWEGVPMVITEFGVWNRPLNGIISAIYNIEYTLRQLQHPNTLYIGAHEVSNKFYPAKNYNNKIINAFDKRQDLDTDELETGIAKTDEGKAFEFLHKATSNADYTWNVDIKGAAKVPGLKGRNEESMYARAFRGTDGYNYLAITNRSGKVHEFDVEFGNEQLPKEVEAFFMYSEIAENKNIKQNNEWVSTQPLVVPSYSIMLLKWENNRDLMPPVTRIYSANVVQNGADLTWWKREFADSYEIHFGENDFTNVVQVDGDKNNYRLKGLSVGKSYQFKIYTINENGRSSASNVVELTVDKPSAPSIFKTSRRDNTITTWWRSVPYANGYKVRIEAINGSFSKIYDAQNVFGFRAEKLLYNQPYNITVWAYNGMGKSAESIPVVVTCKDNIPLPPRDVSATETPKGDILIRWIKQEKGATGVAYNVYRGEKLHHFDLLAENISADHYVDETANGDIDYFYTVKSVTDDGECNFYPNIATVIKLQNAVMINIDEIVEQTDHYLIKSSFRNIPLDGEAQFGVSFSDVSYLTVEENKVYGEKAGDNSFEVKISKNQLTTGHTFAIKAFVSTNGSPIFSVPPHKKIKVN